MENSPEQWHLDKRIPLAIIFTIFLQTGAAFWWASGISQRVNTLESRMVAMSDQASRLVRVETILERIERKLDRIAP